MIEMHHRMTLGFVRMEAERGVWRLRSHEQKQVMQALLAYADELEQASAELAEAVEGCDS